MKLLFWAGPLNKALTFPSACCQAVKFSLVVVFHLSSSYFSSLADKISCEIRRSRKQDFRSLCSLFSLSKDGEPWKKRAEARLKARHTIFRVHVLTILAIEQRYIWCMNKCTSTSIKMKKKKTKQKNKAIQNKNKNNKKTTTTTNKNTHMKNSHWSHKCWKS